MISLLHTFDQLTNAEQLLQERHLRAARHAFNDSEQAGGDLDRCAAGRWMASMLEGDYVSAWKESDSIRLRGAHDPNRFWNGEDLCGARVMVRSLHGYGDAVQMLRYAPMLNRVASRVTFEVPPRLVELAQCMDGVEEVVTWGNAAPVRGSAWDVQVEAMELPYLFRTTVADLPIAANYLQLPREAVERAASAMWAEQSSQHVLRVGLVWAGGDWNPDRSVPFSELRALLQDASVEFWNLQGGMAARQADGATMRHATVECGDGVLALAATIANLDLVITIDTFAAHLAGALGKPAWVLLHYAADWRWLVETNDSPWYPTLRLFRQRRPGDWLSVVEQVQAGLAELLIHKCASGKEAR